LATLDRIVSLKAVSLLFVRLLAVRAANIKVYVGQDNGITFSPDQVRALPGDTVEFLFAGLASIRFLLRTMLGNANFERRTIL
jgi:plastocyanin